MPMYNSSDWIVETLFSISVQTYSNFECIIIDDGSTDKSLEITKKFICRDNRFQLIQRPINLKKGPSSCRNYAFEMAKGQYIQFFDSDDIMHPNHLEQKIKMINKSDFVLCKLQEFKGDFNYDFLKHDNVSDIVKYDNLFEAFVCGNFPMLMVAPLWRTEVLKKYMPFNENLHVLEDHELYSRVLFKVKRYEVINKTLIYYRQRSTSSMNQFHSDLQTGIDSYLLAKKSVLQLSQSKTIKLAILKMVLGVMRMGLAQKKYKSAEKGLMFIKNERLAYSITLKRKIFRIKVFYLLFKLMGRGDTYFKRMLKL